MHNGNCKMYAHFGVSFIFSLHQQNIPAHINVALCNVYFYFLISRAVLNMQQAVLHVKCIAGAGLLRQGLAHFFKYKKKKGLNNRGECWPAENLMVETAEMVL